MTIKARQMSLTASGCFRFRLTSVKFMNHQLIRLSGNNDFLNVFILPNISHKKGLISILCTYSLCHIHSRLSSVLIYHYIKFIANAQIEQSTTGDYSVTRQPI